MDRETKQMTEAQLAERENMKLGYVDAVRDWIVKGNNSEHALDARAVQSRVRLPNDDTALAHAHFQLARYLLRRGNIRQATMHFAKASELHPQSWNIWRQAAGGRRLTRTKQVLQSARTFGRASMHWVTSPITFQST